MRWFTPPEVASVIGSLVILCGSFYLAHHLGDPYIVRRGGAALVIYSLIFAFRAHLLDEAMQELEQGQLSPVPKFAPPKARLVHEVTDDVRHYRRSVVMSSVSRVVRVHLVLAGVGEVLHGFGDLIYILVFGPLALNH